MSKKDEFKLFVSNHPELVDYVNSDKITWQKFYDMYSLYGKDDEVWNKYLKKEEKKEIKDEKTSFSDILDTIKNIDPDELQKNITTINKALTLIGSLVAKDTVKNEYTAPLYKKVEDE